MKRYFYLFILNFSFSGICAQTITLEETRNLYPKSTEDKEICQDLYNRLSSRDGAETALFTGYYGAVAANMSNYLKEPAQKIKYFNLGRSLIEKAIHTDSSDIELRFLRLTIQSNCPKSLHYDKNIQPDKNYILNHLDVNKNQKLKKKIATYLCTVNYTSTEEKEELKKMLKKE